MYRPCMLERIVLLLLNNAGDNEVTVPAVAQVCNCLDKRYGLNMHVKNQMENIVARLVNEQWVRPRRLALELSPDGRTVAMGLQQKAPAFYKAIVSSACRISPVFRPQEA